MRTRPSSRTYVGRLEAGSQAVYVVDALDVQRLTAPETGFGWGIDAVGDTAELAHTLLADAGAGTPSADACSRFTEQILSRLPHDGFTLQRDTVSAWLRRTVAV